MAAVQLHRTKDRGHLAQDIRVERLEEDCDIFEDATGNLVKQFEAIKWRLNGVLISLVGAALLLAANLAFK